MDTIEKPPQCPHKKALCPGAEGRGRVVKSLQKSLGGRGGNQFSVMSSTSTVIGGRYGEL